MKLSMHLIICQRLAIIDHGQIVAEGSPANLKNQIGDDVVRIFIGTGTLGEPGNQEVYTKAAALLAKQAFVSRTSVDRGGIMVNVRDGEASAPVLLEPVMDVEVVTPSDYMGDIIGDLSSRRGKVGGMTDRGDAQIIGASVPLGEMFGYATTLRSLSQGRAVYTMQFAHYEEVPESKAEEIINANGGGR